MNNAYSLMLKLVYPFGSKASKVLSNWIVKIYVNDLKSNVTQFILFVSGLSK